MNKICFWAIMVLSPFFLLAQPANDNCSGAIQITVANAGTCTPGGAYSTVGATNSLSNACMSSLYRDTWYKFTPTTSEVTLEGTGFWSTCKIELFDGCGGNSLICDSRSTPFSITWSGLTANNTYYFRVGVLPSQGEGTINLCLWGQPSTPANDDCVNATVLTIGQGSCVPQQYPMTGATVSGNTAPCTGGGLPDIWFNTTNNASEFKVSIGNLSVGGDFFMEIYDNGSCATESSNSIFCGQVIANTTYNIQEGPGIYTIRIESFNNGSIELCAWQPLTSPYNDCPGVVLTVGNTCNYTTINNTTWTVSNLPSTCGALEFFQDGFIQITVNGDFTVQFNNIPWGSAMLEIYEGTSCLPLGTPVYCDEIWSSNLSHTITGVPAGNYLIRIGSDAGETDGDFDICVWHPLTSPYDDCPGAVLTVGNTCNYTNIDNTTWDESFLSGCGSLEFSADGFIQVNVPNAGDFVIQFGNVPADQDFEVYQGTSCLGTSVYCGFTTGNAQYVVNAPTMGWYLIRTGQDPGAPRGDIQVCVWQSAPLPIQLLTLQAQPQKTTTHLTWHTASESQNAHFDIEHSRNATSFQPIGQVPGHDSTTEPNEYSFTHERPGPGTHYYRLRQVDFDGAHSYSHIVSIDFPSLQDLESLALWPNPTTGIVNFGGEAPEEATYTVSDALGRVLRWGALSSGPMDLSGLGGGAYFINLVTERQVQSWRVFKN